MTHDRIHMGQVGSRENGIDIQPTNTMFSQVLLFDWWLVKIATESCNIRLGISGITERSSVPKVFVSAPIIKRFTNGSLKTADGITVMTCGVINKQHCRDNGFPSEVYDRFNIGFPYNWEECFNSLFTKHHPYKQGMQSSLGVDKFSSSGQGPVNGSNCEPQSNSVSFPTSGTEDAIKFEVDSCSASKSHNEFRMPTRITAKKKMETLAQSNVSQSRTPKKERHIHTCKKLVRQGVLFYSTARKSFASLKTLNLQKSRAGRALVPRLQAGSQDIVYGSDGTICGILTDVEGCKDISVAGAKSEPPRKKKRRGFS